ncbi:MAG TPA: hypothetical protein VFE23_22570 [Usitatibacter sp.]|jgi:hypothetical protein|nr:hypothetical protein [Usitatibacter sp.]
MKGGRAAPGMPQIVFVVPHAEREWADVGGWHEATLDREHARFRRGVDNWIVQGYVRLRPALEAAGCQVAVARRLRRGAICIAHRDALRRFSPAMHDCFIVAVRADRPRAHVGQIEVVQNPLQLGHSGARFIPHWPQPGLVPRDVTRGARLENAVYYGRHDAVPAWYRDARFVGALRSLGVSFAVRDSGWNDYRDVDLVLAHRDETPAMLATKPASKLVNAWLAGVPAVLAAEPAFEALKRGPLDFIPARDAGEALAAIAALKREPSRYRAMVRNGLERGRELDVDAVRAQWLDLLLGEAVPAHARWHAEPGGGLKRIARVFIGMSVQSLEAKRFRAQERRERRALTRPGAGASRG